jgi:phosphatidylglycerophosphate synthase
VKRPDLQELRDVCQPTATMQRRNGEHWLARLVLRRVSLRVTSLLVRTPVTANQLTGLMIVVGIAAAVPAAMPGVLTAAVCAVLVLIYFLLDLCDGEVARWRRETSVKGVYLDRVGHYVVEAALLSAYGLRAGGQGAGGWSTLGVATGLLAVLVKAETDLVDVARARSGQSATTDDAAALRSITLGRLRRVAQLPRINTWTGALESSLLLLAVAAADAVLGGLTVTRALVGLLFGIAAVMSVLHLVSILASRRLQ